jgi:hypothetical protein
MAGYFSNHSQSRFLANSATGTSQTSATAGVHALPQQSANSPTLSRPRAPPSRHFSTSVSTSGDEKLLMKEKAASNSSPNGPVHPLRNTYVRTLIYIPSVCVLIICSWVFWFRQQRHPGNKITNYEEGIKKISAFSSVSCIAAFIQLRVVIPSSLACFVGGVILVHLDASLPSFRLVTHHRLSLVSRRCPETRLGGSTESFGR